MLDMESIQVLHSSLSSVGILNIGTSLGVLSGLGLAVVASIGLGFKSLFVYYLKFDAPKDRPYNTLLLIDQVRFQLRNFNLLDQGHFLSNSSFIELQNFEFKHIAKLNFFHFLSKAQVWRRVFQILASIF